MEIKFHIPSDQIVPTKLRLIADGLHVYYMQLWDCFGYRFEVFAIPGEKLEEERARRIVDEIARVMCEQSYDHGVSWRIESIKMLADNSGISYGYDVKFRVRDAG